MEQLLEGLFSPGEYKILCSTSSLVDYPSGYAVTSFPSLNNTGDDIVLKTNTLLIIDKISYTDDWYKDISKADGGYTIERINPNDPCSDINNWMASNSPTGGTPLLVNSVNNTTPDTQVPSLLSANALSPNFLEVNFSEGMDSTSLVDALYSFNPSLTIQSIYVASTYANQALSQLYTFSVPNVSDCWLNATTISGNFALADNPVQGDLVINEILFDPITGGSDFIELYNRSSKVLNLKDYSIANFDNDTISNNKIITQNYTLFPNEYIVLTADSAYVRNTFPATISGTFYQMSLPSLNNDSSTIYLIDPSNLLLDKVSYKADWQFSLLDVTENKTLERIDPAGISNDKSNWHTAAEPIGFGTPGGKNSQFQSVIADGVFNTDKPAFSPDNDGFEDVIFFNLNQETGDNVVQLTIYDDFGRTVKKIWQSELIGTDNSVSWDGVNDNGIKTPIGVYFAVVSSFNTQNGKTFSKRIAFTLAGKLN
jgi:Lamin Tail Domain/CHU_C Type IX secretion signal domain